MSEDTMETVDIPEDEQEFEKAHGGLYRNPTAFFGTNALVFSKRLTDLINFRYAKIGKTSKYIFIHESKSMDDFKISLCGNGRKAISSSGMISAGVIPQKMLRKAVRVYKTKDGFAIPLFEDAIVRA